LFWFSVFERGGIESRKGGPTNDVAGRHTSSLELEDPTISKVLKREGLKPMRASPSVPLRRWNQDICREQKKPAGVNRRA
jgi:hypothetical protein